MSKWPMTPLGALLTKSEEWITPEPDQEYNEVTVRLWGKGVVLRGRVTGSELAGNRRVRVRANQFILSRIDARNGASGLVPDLLDGAVVTNDFPVYSLNNERIFPSFLNWMSKTAAFVELCKRASEGTTNRVRLKENRFLDTAIPLPPLPEQRRIVARIEFLTTKIEEARGLRSESDRETKSLAHSSADAVFKALSNRYGCKPLSEMCQSITDGDHITPPFTEEGVKFIFVGNVSSGRLHFNGCKYVTPNYFASLKPQRVPKRGDILYSAVGATLGVPAVVEEDEAFCFQRHVAILKPKPTMLSSRFGWHMLQSRTVFDRAWASATGSAQPTVPLRAIRELQIPVVPVKEQRRIVAYLDGLQAKVDALKKLQTQTAVELAALMPSILDKAFKGEL